MLRCPEEGGGRGRWKAACHATPGHQRYFDGRGSIFQRVIGNLVGLHTHREVGLVVNEASHGSGHDEVSSDEAVRASVALGGVRDLGRVRMKCLEPGSRLQGPWWSQWRNVSTGLLSGTNTSITVGGYPALTRWAWSECTDWLVRDCVHVALGRLWRWTHGHMDTNRDIKWFFCARLADLPGRCGAAQRSLCSQDIKETHGSCVARKVTLAICFRADK
jgi:hypothetical protein